jgi:hypothetical protein
LKKQLYALHFSNPGTATELSGIFKSRNRNEKGGRKIKVEGGIEKAKMRIN